MKPEMELLHFFISPGHNFVGHHGKPPGTFPVQELTELPCVAGKGIPGDRYFGHQEDYKGQITFFSYEVYADLCHQFQVPEKHPSLFRRNVITRGIDLNDLIGKEFEIQGVRFFGTEHCKPCYWMDQAFHQGAEKAMHGRGGLRAKILTDGTLRLT